MIHTRSLTKQFGAVRAVDAVDLDVREGDVYGFLGANGSGKTTTVRMLLGLVLATSGHIEVLGKSMPSSGQSVLPQVGALIEGPAAYPHLSGRANLATFDAAGAGSRRRGRGARISEVLEQVGLDPSDRRPVRAYSLGMRQRLALALALLRRPRLLVLDEPTNGLDPQGIHEIRDLLLALNAAGTTIFLSSHLLAEIEKMCTRVGVLDRGRLVLQEGLETLRAPTGRVVVSTPDGDRAIKILGRRVESVADGRIVVEGKDAAEINALLVSGGVRVSEIGPLRISLEDVVLRASEAP
ncbi:MAG: ATP-binding cassette domain-containing protein [Actinomycetota bacterium]|nr:ATP-binding cassette domain-containing protein [Actinomycetota bacterium]